MSKKRLSTTLKKEEEERLLGRITQEEKLDLGLRRSQIINRLKKLTNQQLKDLSESKNQGSGKTKQRNLEIMTDYFYNDIEAWQEFKRDYPTREELREVKEKEREEKEVYRKPERKESTQKLEEINNMSREEKYNFVKKNTYINAETDDEPPAEQIGSKKEVWTGEKKYYKTKDMDGANVYRTRRLLRRRQDNSIVDFVNENRELKEIDQQINKEEEKKAEIEKRFGKFKPLEGEELKKFRGERDYIKDDEYGPFVAPGQESRLTPEGKQEVINFLDEEAEAKARDAPPSQARLIQESKTYGKNLGEFINDDVEETSDLLNTNQNIMGVNEMKTRDKQQDKFNEEKYSVERINRKYDNTPTIIEQIESKYDNTYPTQNEINDIKEIKNDFNNPIYNSSMVDNSNYQESRENLMDRITDLMISNDFIDIGYIREIENLDNNELQDLYNNLLDVEPQEENKTVSNPIARNIARNIANPESESVMRRLSNIANSSRAQAVAQAGISGYQRGGIRGGIREAGANIGGQIGERYGGQIGGQIGQMGVRDILGRIMGEGDGDDEKERKANEAEDLINQINKINDELEQLKEPRKYPEMREIQPINFPTAYEQRSNVKLVQNSITKFLNDVNLYGGTDYEQSNNLLEV